MSTVKEDFIYKNGGAFQKRAEKMFNKTKYSDTVFLVNSAKFHASSHLVSVASDALDTLLTTHFVNCSDKEIKIFEVKYEDSFDIILKYIYGLDINFTQMQPAVMCEVIRLCDLYKLTEFSNDLKNFLSSLENFQIESAIFLLNTAKKTNLTGLYDKLSEFAYQNAERLLNHESFVDLQHDVLLDLLKSDWFCALEINILKGSLTWHADKHKNKSNSNESKTSVHDEHQSDDDTLDISSEEDLTDTEEYTGADGQSDDNTLDTCSEDLTKASHAQVESGADGHGQHILEEFKKNILKTLLSHIRLYNIPAMELVKAAKTDLFKNYLKFLSEDEYFSKSQEPRVQYNRETVVSHYGGDTGNVPNLPSTEPTSSNKGSNENIIHVGTQTDADKPIVNDQYLHQTFSNLIGSFSSITYDSASFNRIIKLGDFNLTLSVNMNQLWFSITSQIHKDWECNLACKTIVLTTLYNKKCSSNRKSWVFIPGNRPNLDSYYSSNTPSFTTPVRMDNYYTDIYLTPLHQCLEHASKLSVKLNSASHSKTVYNCYSSHSRPLIFFVYFESIQFKFK